LLGLQLATAGETKATVLHVVPIAEPASSWHWLDAIDGLQRKLAHPNGHGPALDEVRGLEHWRAKVVSYLERELPAPLLAAARIRVECRAGDPAEEILRFATHQSVDLVILSSGLSRWWLPVVPSRVHRVLRQLRNRVIVVRPEPVAHP
jgi:nucleotide-binding universal stress UspA family protein